jgi:hypothetical protein
LYFAAGGSFGGMPNVPKNLLMAQSIWLLLKIKKKVVGAPMI